jgi:alpha-galactosidase
MDLKYLSAVEKKEIKRQIEFYKKHRRTFQYGRFYRFQPQKNNKVHFECLAEDGKEAIAGFFQTLASPSESYDFLPLSGLDPNSRYTVKTYPQSLFLKTFGGLVKHIMPFSLNPDGFLLRTANKYYALSDCVEEYEGFGDMLMAGIKLNNQFMGSHYNNKTRLLGDFGSNLYVIEKSCAS